MTFTQDGQQQEVVPPAGLQGDGVVSELPRMEAGPAQPRRRQCRPLTAAHSDAQGKQPITIHSPAVGYGQPPRVSVVWGAVLGVILQLLQLVAQRLHALQHVGVVKLPRRTGGF